MNTPLYCVCTSLHLAIPHSIRLYVPNSIRQAVCTSLHLWLYVPHSTWLYLTPPLGVCTSLHLAIPHSASGYTSLHLWLLFAHTTPVDSYQVTNHKTCQDKEALANTTEADQHKTNQSNRPLTSASIRWPVELQFTQTS